MYHKIQSIYKRHREGPYKGKFIEDEWTTPEIRYLADNRWMWTEKIDGTNVRVGWDGKTVQIGGRTDKAQMYIPLMDALLQLFTPELMSANFPKVDDDPLDVCLYGEGYGAKIQKAGGNYRPDGSVSFILFDIRVGHWWLRRDDVEELAAAMCVDHVPIVGRGTIREAVEYVKGNPDSTFGSFRTEGVVCRPEVELAARNGGRIITKIKCKDFDSRA